MSKKKICFFVHTEYHILISVHEILTKYNTDNHELRMIIKRSTRSAKLGETLDLSFVPIAVEYWEAASLDKALSTQQRENITKLITARPDEFIFFQEQDAYAVILTNELASRGTKILLYQDGLKPYVSIKGHSPSLMLNHIKQWRWIKRNGFKAEPFFSFLQSKRYAFLSKIDDVYLTFPESYQNWNEKSVKRIDLKMTANFQSILKKLYKWNDANLETRSAVIFYMNQPMHDDGVFETALLKEIAERFPANPLFIKLHPLTSKMKRDQYEKLDNVKIIESSIPAEVFISTLDKSIVLSVCSTSMFINNDKCKFYWLNKVAEKSIKRLQRYNVVNPTPHIVAINTLKEIVF